MSEERLTAKVILSNLKKHRFDVGDYKLCSKESEIVKTALERFLNDLSFDEELKVIGNETAIRSSRELRNAKGGYIRQLPWGKDIPQPE